MNNDIKVYRDAQSKVYLIQYKGIIFLEVIYYATDKDRRQFPPLKHRLNADEARIYANQRAEFYRERMEK